MMENAYQVSYSVMVKSTVKTMRTNLNVVRKANSCLPENGHFLCHDKSKCLEDDLVCDGNPHCNDKSDEGGKCDNY
ncbi:hypothetical protein Avbf_12007 [Armadillidium vulgare]|nr:hypothetical protein Avbf_12007 [Armadillidium vulgare]